MELLASSALVVFPARVGQTQHWGSMVEHDQFTQEIA
jgi:hypothetical protein